MKIAKGVYQTSGNMYGTNSNTYCLETVDGLVMIDAGFSEKQYEIMREQRKREGLAGKPVQDLFITHCHFDHSGNGWLFQKEGARICMSEKDARAVEAGSPEVLEKMFGRKFHRYSSQHAVKDGQIFDYGNAKIMVLEHPGHTEGTISVLAEIEKKKILFTGDIFTLQSCTPTDELKLEIGWDGSPDYNERKNIETLRRLCDLPPVDIIAPGHGSIYMGDSRELFAELYRTKQRTGI